MAINQSPNELYKTIPKTTKTISPSPTMHLSTTYHTTTLAEDKTILMSLKRLIWFGAILFAVAIGLYAKGWIDSTIVTVVPSAIIELVSGGLLAVYKLVSERSERSLSKITETEQYDRIVQELENFPMEYRQLQFSKLVDYYYGNSKQ